MTMPPPRHFDREDDEDAEAAPPEVFAPPPEHLAPAPPPAPSPPPMTFGLARTEVPYWQWTSPEGVTVTVPVVQDFNPETANYLRQIRAEIQGLQSVLLGFQKGTLPLEDYRDHVLESISTIARLMAMTGIIRGSEDASQRMQNLWRQLLACPLITDPDRRFTTPELLKHVDTMIGICDAIVVDIGILTIPERVNDWLKVQRPGSYIPFHEVFADELPNRESRQKLLNYLAWAPRAISGGIVDAANGLIYCCSTSGRDQFVSLVLLFLAVAATLGIIVGSAYVPADDWPLSSADISALLLAFGAIVMGIIVHLVIATSKRSKSEGRPPVIALSMAPMVLNAYIGQFFWKLVSALIALFGLVFFAGIEEVTVLNAFLAGYALDSVVETFGASLEQKAGTRAQELKGSP